MRIIRWSSEILFTLLAPICVNAQEKSHLTFEQVNKAIQEVEKLAQKQIQENALPGLAIAIVFQDKAESFRVYGLVLKHDRDGQSRQRDRVSRQGRIRER